VEVLQYRLDIIRDVLKLLIPVCGAAVLNTCDNNGLTLFAELICHERILTNDMLQLMLRHGFDITDTSKFGETVLMRIVNNRFIDVETVETLLRNGASETINHIYHYRIPLCALAYAVSPFSSKSPEIVRLLIQYGADLSIPVVSYSALTVAYDTPSMTRLLLDLGADVHARDNNGQTVILRRLAPSNESFRMLIDAGARLMDTDNDGNTSLMCLFEDIDYPDYDITAEIEMISAEIDRYHC
jgi:ankyrin repeat protein